MPKRIHHYEHLEPELGDTSHLSPRQREVAELISKGYKTYLLLANNFHYYYPHPENSYPQLEPIVRHYCEEMFPGCYDAERGVLDFGRTPSSSRTR